jgi:glycosyltransferase involved in cell wall biosynthesis
MALPLRKIDDIREAPQSVNSGERLAILWVAALDYKLGWAHGGNLRLFSYGQELISQGHEVHLLVLERPGESEGERTRCLEELRDRRIITSFRRISYRQPKLRGKIAHLLSYPGLANFILRKQQAPIVHAIRDIIAERQIDACIFSARDLLFALPKISKDVPAMIDWVDSYFLYYCRAVRLEVKGLRLRQALHTMRLLVEAFIRERYYSRRSAANFTVSPADKKYLDLAGSTPGTNHVVLNGVKAQTSNGTRKTAGQLIFTGNMDFPPNYQSALWFIDRVFPLLRERSDTQLVIAGANPISELTARADERIRVTGYVSNLSHEIAGSDLYVAPLVCGGGFKNKVVEAISSGTYVVGTSMAVEFLPTRARKHILTGDSPRELADAILAYFDQPEYYARKLQALREIVMEEFTWKNRTNELLAIMQQARGRQSRPPGNVRA